MILPTHPYDLLVVGVGPAVSRLPWPWRARLPVPE